GLQFCAMAVLFYRKHEALLRFRSVYYLMLFRPLVLATIQLNLLTEIDTQWVVYCLKEASLWYIYWQLLLAVQPFYRADLFMDFASGTLHGNVESRESGSPAPVRQGGEGQWEEFARAHANRVAVNMDGPAQLPVVPMPGEP
ncbi:GA2OX2, partial [Symbiodinium natans]